MMPIMSWIADKALGSLTSGEHPEHPSLLSCARDRPCDKGQTMCLLSSSPRGAVILVHLMVLFFLNRLNGLLPSRSEAMSRPHPLLTGDGDGGGNGGNGGGDEKETDLNTDTCNKVLWGSWLLCTP